MCEVAKKGNVMRSLAHQTRLQVERSNVTPVWLLPFWRLLRTEAQGDYAIAYRLLAKRLPTGTPIPTKEQTAIVLLDHGLIC